MTIGISPKVALPAILQLIVGVVLVVVGLVAGDHTVRDAGLVTLAAGTATAGVGYAAPAGAVARPVVQPSDELLSADARARLDKI